MECIGTWVDLFGNQSCGWKVTIGLLLLDVLLYGMDITSAYPNMAIISQLSSQKMSLLQMLCL